MSVRYLVELSSVTHVSSVFICFNFRYFLKLFSFNAAVLYKNPTIFFFSMSCNFSEISFVIKVSISLATKVHRLILYDRVGSGARFLTGVCLSATLLIVDLWQNYVRCTRLGATLCTLFMVLFQYGMRQCGSHAVS